MHIKTEIKGDFVFFSFICLYRQRLPRSDASLEGWHYAIQATLGIHPQFYLFLERLRTEANWADQTMALFRSGARVQRARHAGYAMLDANLQRLVQQYEANGEFWTDDQLYEYLLAVSRCFRHDEVDDVDDDPPMN